MTKEVQYRSSTTNFETSLEILNFLEEELMNKAEHVDKRNQYMSGIRSVKECLWNLRDNQCVCD